MRKKRKIESCKTIGFIPDGVKVFIEKATEHYEEGQIYSIPAKEATRLIKMGFASFPKKIKDVQVVIKNETRVYKKKEALKLIKRHQAKLTEPPENENSFISLATYLETLQPQADSMLRDLIAIYLIGGDMFGVAKNAYPELHEDLVKAEVAGTEDLTFKEFTENHESYLTGFKSVRNLLKKNPMVIRLPFVSIAIENFLMVYRFGHGTLLEELRLLWTDMLPNRQGGDVPYSDELLMKFITIGIKDGYTKHQAIKLISKKLDISIGKLSKLTSN